LTDSSLVELVTLRPPLRKRKRRMMLKLSPKNLLKTIRKLRPFKSRAKLSRNRRRKPLLRRNNKLRRSQRLI
jgi:hypothetical protein